MPIVVCVRASSREKAGGNRGAKRKEANSFKLGSLRTFWKMRAEGMIQDKRLWTKVSLENRGFGQIPKEKKLTQ